MGNRQHCSEGSTYCTELRQTMPPVKTSVELRPTCKLYPDACQLFHQRPRHFNSYAWFACLYSVHGAALGAGDCPWWFHVHDGEWACMVTKISVVNLAELAGMTFWLLTCLIYLPSQIKFHPSWDSIGLSNELIWSATQSKAHYWDWHTGVQLGSFLCNTLSTVQNVHVICLVMKKVNFYLR